jgi:prepilin-type N-terminal cleavage/methylation domain-containing protein
MFSHINKKAFTLIELLVVVLIIGILAAIALPKYQSAIEKAKTRKAITLMNALRTAAEEVFLIKGGYTAKLSDFSISLPCTATGTTSWGDYCDTPDFRIFLNSGEIYAHRDKIYQINGALETKYEIMYLMKNPTYNGYSGFACAEGQHASSPKNMCKKMGYSVPIPNGNATIGPFLME